MKTHEGLLVMTGPAQFPPILPGLSLGHLTHTCSLISMAPKGTTLILENLNLSSSNSVSDDHKALATTVAPNVCPCADKAGYFCF